MENYKDYMILFGAYDNEHPADHYNNRKSRGKIYSTKAEAIKEAIKTNNGHVWEVEHDGGSGDILSVTEPWRWRDHYTLMYINYRGDGSKKADLNKYSADDLMEPDEILTELQEGVEVLERGDGERIFKFKGVKYLDHELFNDGETIYIIGHDYKRHILATVIDDLAYRL